MLIVCGFVERILQIKKEMRGKMSVDITAKIGKNLFSVDIIKQSLCYFFDCTVNIDMELHLLITVKRKQILIEN